MKTQIKFLYTSVLFILIFSSVPLHSQIFEDILGHSGDYFNYKQFESLFGRATTDVNQTIPLQLENGVLKGIASKEEMVSNAGQGAWKVVLTGWREVGGYGDGEISIEYCPSAVLNYGDRMEYVFYSPEIPDAVFEIVEPQLAEIKEELLTEYDDMKVNWGRDQEKILVTAVYSYAGGVDSDDIEERIVFLMNRCRDLIRKTMETTYDAKEDYLDNLKDKTYSYMTQSEFEGLVSEMNIKRFRDEQSEAKEGSYTFTTEEVRNLKFFNTGNSIEFAYWHKIAYGLTDESKKTLFDKINEWVKSNPMDKAEMVVQWYPNYVENILVKAVYNLDGAIEGSDIYDNFYEFNSGWTTSLYDEIKSIVEGYTENLMDEKLNYLEKGVFLLLIKNDIFNFEEGDESVPEGFWGFNVEDTYQYEIYNYGNNLWMTSWYKLPDHLTQESIEEIIRNTQQFADENSFSDKFEYIVRNYPGADKGYIQLIASLEFPEPVEGRVIAEGYHSFVYDLTQETHSHLEGLVEDF